MVRSGFFQPFLPLHHGGHHAGDVDDDGHHAGDVGDDADVEQVQREGVGGKESDQQLWHWEVGLSLSDHDYDGEVKWLWMMLASFCCGWLIIITDYHLGDGDEDKAEKPFAGRRRRRRETGRRRRMRGRKRTWRRRRRRRETGVLCLSWSRLRWRLEKTTICIILIFLIIVINMIITVINVIAIMIIFIGNNIFTIISTKVSINLFIFATKSSSPVTRHQWMKPWKLWMIFRKCFFSSKSTQSLLSYETAVVGLVIENKVITQIYNFPTSQVSVG